MGIIDRGVVEAGGCKPYVASSISFSKLGVGNTVTPAKVVFKPTDGNVQ